MEKSWAWDDRKRVKDEVTGQWVMLDQSNFEYALENLRKAKSEFERDNQIPVITRMKAEDIMGLSSGVFGREFKGNSLFLAYCKQTSGARALYAIDDLIDHLLRLQDPAEIARLYCYRDMDDCPESFSAYYSDKDKESIFKEGTSMPFLERYN